MSSAAVGKLALGWKHVDAGWACVGATSIHDLIGLHGAAEPFEAQFTLTEVAAQRVMGAPAAGFSGVAHAWRRMGIGPARFGSDLRRAYIHYNHGYGGIDHSDAQRVLRQRSLPEDVLR